MTLTDFLKEEQERFDAQFGNDVFGGDLTPLDKKKHEEVLVWLSSHDSRLIAKIREMVKDVLTKKENIHGFQPFGYAEKEQESEIYFKGFSDGRVMLKIDMNHLLSLLPSNDKENA